VGLDDRVVENRTFSVKYGLKLAGTFAGTLMIPERFWTYSGSSRNKLDPFRNTPEGNWGQSCKFRKFRRAILEHSGGEMAEVKNTGGKEVGAGFRTAEWPFCILLIIHSLLCVIF
jgi:hypothetical protein